MTITELYDKVGGDYANLINRIPKENLIIRFIKKYAENEDTANMVAAFKEKDYQKVFSTSHNVKGMSANLSLNRITANVSQICEAVRHGEPEIDLSAMIEQAEKDHALLVELVAQL